MSILKIKNPDGTWTGVPTVQGDKGDPGLTPDIQIGTVETLKPDQKATASITGTPEKPELNLGIPQGKDGNSNPDSGLSEETKKLIISIMYAGAYNSDQTNNLAELRSLFGLPAPNNYKAVTWEKNGPIYGIGNNLKDNYQCWCPHNLQFDKTRRRFVFSQCHRSGHTGSYKSATMHIIHPETPLLKEDIQIPAFNGIMNFLIVDKTYYLYPKTDGTKRYSSEDGGVTWEEEPLVGLDEGMFGCYFEGGEFFGGSDYEWDTYYHSLDGKNWEKLHFNYTDAEGNQTKEHSFVTWKENVYAFGRRDFNVSGAKTGTGVMFVLENGAWKVVDDSHIHMFQSNATAVPFEDKLAITHIDRVQGAGKLYYTVYDGQTFTTEELPGANKPNEEGAFTTPSLAFGNGYAVVAYSRSENWTNAWLNAMNCMYIGCIKNKTVPKYFNLVKTPSIPYLGPGYGNFDTYKKKMKTVPENVVNGFTSGPGFDQFTPNYTGTFMLGIDLWGRIISFDTGDPESNKTASRVLIVKGKAYKMRAPCTSFAQGNRNVLSSKYFTSFYKDSHYYYVRNKVESVLPYVMEIELQELDVSPLDLSGVPDYSIMTYYPASDTRSALSVASYFGSEDHVEML